MDLMLKPAPRRALPTHSAGCWPTCPRAEDLDLLSDPAPLFPSFAAPPSGPKPCPSPVLQLIESILKIILQNL